MMAVSVTAAAEGYQVNVLSTRQNGMGHTGTALKLGSESMIFNPGAMSWLDKAIDFRGSFSAVVPSTKAKLPSGESYSNNSTVSTPLSANLAMRVYDNLAVGISFYTPYGSNIDWGDNWPGAELNQRVKLSIYTVQPTVSWRPFKDVPLSIGAGVMVTWGSVNLSKGLVSGASLDAVLGQMGNPYRFGQTTPASVTLNGKSDVAVGANLGIYYQINKQWSVGMSWRSQQTMKVRSGRAAVSYANDIARTILESRLGMMHNSNFAASMPAAWVWNTGVAYRPTDRWTVTVDAQMTGWHAYDKLDIDFLSEQLAAYDQHITKNYKNSWTVKMGAQWEATQRLALRCGLMIDQTPVNKDYYNPETPGMTKLSPSAGLSFEPLPNFSIDASVLYTAGLSRDGQCTYKDLLLGVDRTFKARYSVSAWSPSVGFSLHF